MTNRYDGPMGRARVQLTSYAVEGFDAPWPAINPYPVGTWQHDEWKRGHETCNEIILHENYRYQ